MIKKKLYTQLDKYKITSLAGRGRRRRKEEEEEGKGKKE